MKRMLPIGIQDFKELRERNCIYVDKTEILHKLITDGKYYFLSRPRRFGKSLTISTLNEIFEGNQELFKGLFIYDKIEWKKRPVIRIDFTSDSFKKFGLEDAITNILRLNYEKYGLSTKEKANRAQFRDLITQLHAKSNEKVALLIDEYDKPIIDYMTDIDKAEENRDILRDFYGIIKPMDPHLEFVILTGVTKFSKVSIFSELNNLRDITTSEHYSTIVGLTKEEIEANFNDYEAESLKKFNLSREDFYKELKNWYNGYSWDNKKEVYNPFSVLNFFQEQNFSNYWFATGTPTFLINFIRDNGVKPEEFENMEVDSIFFDRFDLVDMDIKALMFQTGYLTIKEKNEYGFFILNYPNKEVRDSFTGHLLSGLSKKDVSSTGQITTNILKSLAKNNIEDFQDNINALFSSIPHQLFIKDTEAYYHSLIFLILKMVGVYIDCEVSVNKGRVDSVIKTKEFLYVIEFKMMPATPGDAIAQIKTKGYAEPYKTDSRQKFMIGVSFDANTKKFADFLVEAF